MATPRLRAEDVFLNIPYDEPFRALYVAYIVGLVDFGLTPVVTLGIPGGDTRLDRIYDLIRASRYSIHDLSRVELDHTAPITPRFNMPFELGMAVAWAKLQPSRHTFLVFETLNRRGHKSLSDLSGTDFNIHAATPEGVMRELCSAFVRRSQRPTVPAMMRHFHLVSAALPKLLKENGTQSPFEARTFSDIVLLTKRISESDPSPSNARRR